jgi:hypothetical protein
MARFGVLDTPIAVGDTLAFPFTLGEKPDWFQGKVLRLSRPHWADVDFADGKLWMKTKMEDRGKLWIKLTNRCK